MPNTIATLCAAALITLPLLAGCNPPPREQATAKPELKFTTDYQAVFMDNGQVFFGKLEQAGSDYPILRSAYAVRNQVNPETKEVRSELLKRSAAELHNPDYMALNARHIVAIEPVGANSRVAQLMRQGESTAAPPKP
ncbi:MAG: hypothetical protein KJ958_06810 [Gammaproteobacteria bacterium]|nr:hypothetical protein [Gammaproteobacteria bacterium]MBU1978866.1 hypothetical protein [Gammaproteobacteria bacterium]